MSTVGFETLNFYGVLYKCLTEYFGYRPYQIYVLWFQVLKFSVLTLLPLLEVTSLLKMEYFGIESLQPPSNFHRLHHSHRLHCIFYKLHETFIIIIVLISFVVFIFFNTASTPILINFDDADAFATIDDVELEAPG